jgi:hypothetical protein
MISLTHFINSLYLKFYLNVLFFISPLLLFGQNQVTISPPRTLNSSTLSELLMVQVQNNVPSSLTGVIEFKISQNNNLVLSGVTKNINLQALSSFNLTSINNEQTLKPYTFSFVAPSMQKTMVHNNPLPLGNYSICVRFLSNNQPISDEVCATTMVTPIASMGNLRLLYPQNNGNEVTLNPIFMWSNSGVDLLYQLKVVEILDGQNKFYAINNAPHLLQDNLNSNTLIYPLVARELENCKEYAWQVKTYNKYKQPSGNEIASSNNLNQDFQLSEIFSFKTPCEQQKAEENISIKYVLLKKDFTPYVHAFKNLVSFKYEANKYSKNTIEVKISLLSTNEVIYHNKEFVLNKTSGANYLSIDKKDLKLPKKIDKNEIFLLEAINLKNEVFFTKFKFTND